MSPASSGQNAGMLEIAEIAPKRGSLGHRILPNAGELVSLASSGQNAGMPEVRRHRTAVWFPKQPTNPPHIGAR